LLFNRLPPPPTLRHPATRPQALQGLAYLLVVCLLLQSLLLPAQRTAARMHVHLGSVWAQPLADAWSDPAPRALFVHARALKQHASAAHANSHAHAHPASHDHTGHDGDDSVALSSSGSEDPASAAAVLKRHFFENDTVGSQPQSWSTAAPTQAVASDAPLRHRSHVQPPLERPPRARG